jgi:hypothetical protein
LYAGFDGDFFLGVQDAEAGVFDDDGDGRAECRQG